MRSIGRVALLAFVVMLALAGAAQADTFEVNKLGDPAPGSCTNSHCTLREAVLAANNDSAGPDKVVLPNRKRAYKLTIPNADPSGEDGGTEGDLDVTNDRLTILHPGRGRATIDQRQFDRVIDAFSALTLKRIGITGGETVSALIDGAGVRSDALLTLKRASVFGNHGDDGGALAITGGALKMSRSALMRNRSDDDAGAVTFTGPLSTAVSSIVASRVIGNQAGSDDYDTEHGGAIDLSTGGSRLTIKKSTFAGNHTVVEGGAIYSDNPDQIKIVDSTFSGNRADTVGGGALYLESSTVTIVNSTITGNTANDEGGGIHASAGAEVSLNAVTVARNRGAADDPGPVPPTGGGIFQIDSTFEVRNSLIGLNTIGVGGIQRQDCEGDTFTSLGHNLLSTDVECDGFTQPSDLIRNNPKIGKLRRNGGPTKTIALKKGSAAIGKAHKPSAPNRDQRGFKRDNKPDIGAFERGA